ncbi:uncharacterized protein, partial [Diadema antillarum]|uniref:uncharacterized protein n=1 Tax=Diadema antillarum TaxID=105358 RepID=UPI003A879897
MQTSQMDIVKGISSPSAHPPLPKKPSLAPKPKGIASPSTGNNNVQETADSVLDNSPAAPAVPASEPQPPSRQVPSSDGSVNRPTPKPRKTIIKSSTGSAEPSPSPRPRVPPKRILSTQSSDENRLDEPHVPTSNGTSHENKAANGVAPVPRERPNVPVRRLTLGSSLDLPPTAPHRTSPGRSPVHSNSSVSDSRPKNDSVTDDRDEKADIAVHETSKTSESQNVTLTSEPLCNGPASASKSDTNTAQSTTPSQRPKPSVSPKKPSLASLQKSHATSPKNSDRSISSQSPEHLKKPAPLRPALPPKRHSAMAGSSGSLSRVAIKGKPRKQQSAESALSSDQPELNGNRSTELPDLVPSDTSTNSLSNSSEKFEKQSTPSSSDPLYVNTDSVSRNESMPKTPSVLSRKPAPQRELGPVAPPRRVKSMSESDPISEPPVEKVKDNG